MNDEAGGEIDLRELLERLWQGRLIIVMTTAVAVALGAGAYYLAPEVYQSRAVVYPITQSDYARYTDLVARSAISDPQSAAGAEGPEATAAFPYTRDNLFQEFISYLQSPNHLIHAAQESGIGQQDDASALAFTRSIRFTQPTEKTPWFEMRVRAGDREALGRFVAKSLDDARLETARKIRAATVDKIESGRKIRADAIHKLQVEIDARRNQQDKTRKDQIAVLTEQAKIAEKLGIQDPVTVQSVILQSEPAPNASAQNSSAQVTAGEQPLYLQGSTALEEQIALLNTRGDNDPFTAELRDLERRIYVLKNDAQEERLAQLLEQSPLGDPATAPLAEYSLVGASAEKVFPKAGIFGAAALLLGLMLGSMIALLRKAPRRSR